MPIPNCRKTPARRCFYTTGTTGDPKGVSYTHRQLVLHTLAVTADLGTVPGKGGIKRDDVYMPITPLFHVHGWGFPYLATFLGLKQVYPGRYEPSRLLALIAQHQVDVFALRADDPSDAFGGPRSGGDRPFALEGVDWRVSLARGLALQARAKGIDIHAAYGMSETCPFVTHADMVASQSSEDIGVRTATGRPAALVEVRVVDPEMRDVPRDGRSTGEVIARAPWLTHGYLRNEGGTAELWAGGWMHTGDVGHMAPDGTAADYRPAEGCDQVGRGMGVFADLGKHRLDRRGSARGGGGGCAG